jgi:hypothetical protein
MVTDSELRFENWQCLASRHDVPGSEGRWVMKLWVLLQRAKTVLGRFKSCRRESHDMLVAASGLRVPPWVALHGE